MLNKDDQPISVKESLKVCERKANFAKSSVQSETFYASEIHL
jgi:hypothetical protein